MAPRSSPSPPPDSTLGGTFSTFSVDLPAAPWPASADKVTGANYRRHLSSEEWEALRPIVKRLYIDKNKTFDEVAVVFRDEHNFNPT